MVWMVMKLCPLIAFVQKEILAPRICSTRARTVVYSQVCRPHLHDALNVKQCNRTVQNHNVDRNCWENVDMHLRMCAQQSIVRED